MKDIVANPDLVARCGLYCGACRTYLKGRCPGCRENAKAGWCKIRGCCAERSDATCADCTEHPDPATCPKFNNLIARVFGVVFNSDRAACVRKIRGLGVEGFAAHMSAEKRQSLPRRGG